ncbi:hypothetical protein Ga0466249_002264 [Sporomusaceae bacterium BoRhaA]|uniref:hypothetical protein n=1 Tax=Pelorhabdus rhamnosifermentans TaxID=2772457 RepID=UPI001C062C0C|nr:hypothetical protein [Pelorhabdus rhamnosifermentans]MBU2701150.1 hypothetical protein [Pelorhabdus rhamnosifermentans]
MNNSIDNNTTYELFIRQAFSVGKNEMVGRWGDPAQLANTDVFSDVGIEEVKTAVAYSIAIYRSYCENANSNDKETMSNCLKNVINAPDKKAIINIINKFEDIRKKYYKHNWIK